MVKASFEKYQYLVGGQGFIRKVEWETEDGASIIHVNHVGTLMSRAQYYADERPAQYWVKKELLNG